MITKLSTKIVDNLLLITNNDSLSDNRDVYIYGLECIFNTLFTFVILILVHLHIFLTVFAVLIFKTILYSIAFQRLSIVLVHILSIQR